MQISLLQLLYRRYYQQDICMIKFYISQDKKDSNNLLKIKWIKINKIKLNLKSIMKYYKTRGI